MFGRETFTQNAALSGGIPKNLRDGPFLDRNNKRAQTFHSIWWPCEEFFFRMSLRFSLIAPQLPQIDQAHAFSLGFSTEKLHNIA